MRKLNRAQKGKRAEWRVMSLFIERGWQVFSPHGEESEVDLVAYHRASKRLLRVQVKHTSYVDRRRSGSGRWVNLQHNRGSAYRADDFDLLAVVSDHHVYLVSWAPLCVQLGRPPVALNLDPLRPYEASLWDGWAVEAKPDPEEPGDGQLDLFDAAEA